mgnify:CR=1 FL=1|nr:MAG TPA: hypothetical protein [Caudoviricetes sp.]
MEFWSWVMAFILGVSAIVSPIVTAIINNCHQTKIKKLEIFNASRITALNEFIEATEAVILSHDNNDLNDYFSSVNKLFIYFDNLTLDTFKELDDFLKDNDSSKANHCLTVLVAYLSNQIQKD